MNVHDQDRYCHASLRSASRCPSRQMLSAAKHDKLAPVLLVKPHHCALADVSAEILGGATEFLLFLPGIRVVLY